MPYKISIDDPKFAKDEEIAIPHLTVVPNGGTAEVSDEDAELYGLRTGQTVEEIFKDSKDIKVVKVSASASNKKEGGD